MTNVARQLLELLDIEQLEIDLFRGIGSGGETTTRIFGGHVIAQALMAAYRTVPDRMCHSLHAYFIRPGDPSIPVIYQVDRARDGGSFTTRRVVAIQHGKQIFNLSASFHVQEEGWDYQHKMPDVKGPEHWLDRPANPISKKSRPNTATISCANALSRSARLIRAICSNRRRPRTRITFGSGWRRQRGSPRSCSTACSPMRPI